MSMPSIAYVLDPRFPGGTSSAVAAELEAVHGLAAISVHAISCRMFSGTSAAPQLQKTLTRLGLDLIWDAAEIAADVVIFHNPSCLKFQDSFAARIVTRELIVVTHENFLRPGGAEAFDVAKCLDQIAQRSIAMSRKLAPVSAWNRKTISDWLDMQPGRARWSLMDETWFNICSFDLEDPSPAPTDRRGRHSRPGFEKFPQRDVMALCFPPSAQSNVILGADILIDDETCPPHWDLHQFRSLSLPQYFEKIDFMVYYTAPTWRESFGRVLAEAIAAGKIVISDPETASGFDGAVIGADPAEVDQIISDYIGAPKRYRADVRKAQRKLERFSAANFRAQLEGYLAQFAGEAA